MGQGFSCTGSETLNPRYKTNQIKTGIVGRESYLETVRGVTTKSRPEPPQQAIDQRSRRVTPGTKKNRD